MSLLTVDTCTGEDVARSELNDVDDDNNGLWYIHAVRFIRVKALYNEKVTSM